MSLTIATQPSVSTAPGPTRGASSDPAAAGSFGAALTAAVATERRPGDGAAGRDDTDGRTADGSAATPSTAATPSASTSASASDQSVPATGSPSGDAQALLAAGLVTVAAPTAPAGLTSGPGDQSATAAAETPAGDQHVAVATAGTAGTTATPASVTEDASTPVPSTPAPTTTLATTTPQQAPAAGGARQNAAGATTGTATTATTTPAVSPAGTASPAAAATIVAGATPATTTSATTAVSMATAATDPATTAPTAATAIAAPAATRTADGDTATVPPGQAPVVTAAPAAGAGSRAGHGTEQQASTPGDPGLPAVAPSRGGETPFVMSTTPTAAPAATTAPAPAPLAQQLARPVFSLAQAGPGEHVVTVQVVPDSLGPVTVRAHVTAHGMHVELFAASDAGREAVRQVLPDLRRDTAGTGVSTTLDLSSQNQPQDAPGRDERPAARAVPGDPGLEARVTPRAQPTAHTPSIRTAGLDVLA
ncbi:flagellar hook-length control protein FliK [Curtobacterium flaccumfaciens]|uniref:flagellar hook-length control protein FliK n=1 Tax=Curtobacterium flaccumfaciens TaxID=2035 RepID=UPI001BDEDFA0|nr:flagellar hook-length control protein FliK [Curtobacterium flaccumfaciens]MBT1607001.1 flagellar hook-length control protein FliK [Curtobacterium flaccumfaciens pv. betae]MBT1655129.1 flagellar hook-length control protein FliK [Curtobacterium flaccumfaciens pv. betae]MCS0469792.1 flagellar hook-length control protein FliK [Curtobacterium flaccumfaciens pv. betae]MCS0472958.1 flagellar hook-length control protein FliK [Curtobacterium flaccumfaciens pv. betae]MCS0476640.1 flagellar hook-lengt